MIFRVVFAVSLFLSTIDSLDVLNRKNKAQLIIWLKIMKYIPLCWKLQFLAFEHLGNIKVEEVAV